MKLRKKDPYITEEDYLKGELESDIKYEYIDGKVYAMSGAKINHNRLSAVMTRKFGNTLEGKPCDALQSDFKVKVGKKYFYPDVVVKCDSEHDHDDYTGHPIIIVEVASESTRKFDRTYKLGVYRTIPSLKEYVLVETDECLVDVYKREGSLWNCTTYILGDDIHFESIGLIMSVEEIYERVNNKDMRKFLINKSQKI